MPRPFFANTIYCPIHISEQMVGLHGGDHSQLAETRELVRRHYLRMFDPPAMIFTSWIGHSRLVLPKKAFRFRKTLQSHLHTTVADGMEPHVEAGCRPVIYQRVELRLRVLRKPGVLWVITVRLNQR